MKNKKGQSLRKKIGQSVSIKLRNGLKAVTILGRGGGLFGFFQETLWGVRE